MNRLNRWKKAHLPVLYRAHCYFYVLGAVVSFTSTVLDRSKIVLFRSRGMVRFRLCKELQIARTVAGSNSSCSLLDFGPKEIEAVPMWHGRVIVSATIVSSCILTHSRAGLIAQHTAAMMYRREHKRIWLSLDKMFLRAFFASLRTVVRGLFTIVCRLLSMYGQGR